MAHALQYDQLLCSELLDLIEMVSDLNTPNDVLEKVHEITTRSCNMSVIGAVRLPSQFGDFDAVVERKTIFLHESIPAGWWHEYLQTSQAHPSPIYAMAQLSLSPFTISESMQTMDPVGADRWSVKLLQKYGIRDGLACPVGGSWVFAFWSTDVLTKRMTPQLRALLFFAANVAVIRLQELVGDQAELLQETTTLTAREQAVLLSLSRGNRVAETAEDLGIGEETVRTHIKKAQAKLNVRSQVHAVALAIRQRLIP